MISYITVSEWGLVILWSFNCLFYFYVDKRIFAEMILLS